ncbi:MAG TPA: efflux RND transporter periplasmic adaptor subunit [Azoarcus taiwanensis]|uniref:efflux RND transporter periplasmic adaptor subunit n=1 Tax=Azoarcus taiwanensis TaxID=666964 RepID=UPI001B7D28AB|nr:efflux RND transporter periplasmic adaptor subunit [Azoarcus taiwanensis]HRQ59325.1 efflux RND transporter periplasmic adaptor subunit [Azoarcus taiwanensis]
MKVSQRPQATWWRIRGVLALLVMTSVAACGGEAPTATTLSAGPLVPVAAIEIQPRDLYRQLSVSGTVEARVRVRVPTRSAGLVETVTVEEGEHVAAGRVLATLDLSEARAELVRARAEENSARLEFRRASELRERGAVSASQLDAARVALEVAESERALWETRVGFATVAAPIAGVVSARHVEPGEAVQAQATLFELTALDELVVRVGVSELDVVHLGVGQTLAVHIDALPALELVGTVRRIFPVAESVSRQTTVEIALPGEAAGLGVRPGFLARVRARVDQRLDVLVVPVAAVGADDDGHYVFAIDDGALVRRNIEIGVTRAEWVEVAAGLRVGEKVLASNPIEMRAGQAVRVVSMRNGADVR